MSQILTIIGGIIKLILLRIAHVQADDADKKEKLKEASKEVENGIKERDPSRITAGFDAINRV